jgi:hypothetical protein
VTWANDDMVLYHGCSDTSLAPINPKGITAGGGPHNIGPGVGAKRPDFGRGFYTTTWLHQAMNWANTRVYKAGGRAVVLRMRVERNSFASLETLVFPSDRDKFYAFVSYCRRGRTPHAPLARRTGPYDIVTGPVSAGRQSLVIGGTDQVSFHTSAAVGAIFDVTVLAVGRPMFDVWQ